MRITLLTVFVVTLSLSLLAPFTRPALAADPGEGAAPAAPAEGAPPAESVAAARPDHPRRMMSLTISPLHLFLPIVELTGEYRVLDKLGVAAIAGAGRYSDTSNGISISATALEA